MDRNLSPLAQQARPGFGRASPGLGPVLALELEWAPAAGTRLRTRKINCVSGGGKQYTLQSSRTAERAKYKAAGSLASFSSSFVYSRISFFFFFFLLAEAIRKLLFLACRKS
jgi:hypothetical protein